MSDNTNDHESDNNSVNESDNKTDHNNTTNKDIIDHISTGLYVACMTNICCSVVCLIRACVFCVSIVPQRYTILRTYWLDLKSKHECTETPNNRLRVNCRWKMEVGCLFKDFKQNLEFQSMIPGSRYSNIKLSWQHNLSSFHFS